MATGGNPSMKFFSRENFLRDRSIRNTPLGPGKSPFAGYSLRGRASSASQTALDRSFAASDKGKNALTNSRAFKAVATPRQVTNRAGNTVTRGNIFVNKAGNIGTVRRLGAGALASVGIDYVGNKYIDREDKNIKDEKLKGSRYMTKGNQYADFAKTAGSGAVLAGGKGGVIGALVGAVGNTFYDNYVRFPKYLAAQDKDIADGLAALEKQKEAIDARRGGDDEEDDKAPIPVPTRANPYARGYTPDEGLAAAKAANDRAVEADLAAVEALRRQRISEARSRYNLNGPSREENDRINQQVANINADAQRAGEAINRSYGAASAEATKQFATAQAIAARSAGDTKRYYEAASSAVSAQNSQALLAAAGGTADLGLGNTAISGEATLAPTALEFQGLADAADAETDATVRRDDLAFLRDTTALEQADQTRDVYRRGQDNTQEARMAWQQQVAARIAQERDALASQEASINGNMDAQRFSLLGERRNTALDIAKLNASGRADWDARRLNYEEGVALDDFDLAQQDYQDQVAARRGESITSLFGNNSSGGVLQTAQDLTGNPAYAESGEAYIDTAIKNKWTSNLQGIAGLPAREQRAEIDKFLGSLSNAEIEYLQSQGAPVTTNGILALTSAPK